MIWLIEILKINRRTAVDKVLRDKALASMVYKFFDKKTIGSSIKNENIPNEELTEKLHKPITRNYSKRKEHSPFIDNSWGADLADMQLVSKSNNGFRFVSPTDICSKYAWVIPLKDKKGITITNAFKKLLDESNWKPNKIWVEKDSKFYNRLMQSWLEKKSYRNAFDT